MDPYQRIGAIIQDCRGILSDRALEVVDHYNEHGEFEMAFEGLVIELIKADAAPDSFDYEEWCGLLRAIGLDQEQVFDVEIWNKFIEWGRTVQ